MRNGIVNVISKMPPAEPIRYIETGVNNFGNAYIGFDVGGPIATQPQDGKLYYRVVGEVRNGGTQVDFTPDNNYFIAPSFTWKPDADTTFTVLASASKTDTRGINFLPYQGTVTNAPFGKIPTSFFVGDPNVDKFTREQEMLGYRFERNLNDDLTFRQNARFAHIDLTYRGFIGNGWADINTATMGRYNWYAKNTANQANLDNQLEYRFNTGPVRHTMLFGVDLKGYQIDDYQNFNFGTVPSINVFNPVYGLNIPLTGAPFRNFQITQKQAGTYLQDQMKLGNFTLVLSGRNDWVETTQNARDTGAAVASRDDSKFSGRAGLIYNFDNGIAPYISYATSYNPVIGLNASNQLFLPETGQQTEIGVKVSPKGFDGYFTASVFDLKRQNVATTAGTPILLNQTGEVTSRGIELEAVANATRELKPGSRSVAGRQDADQHAPAPGLRLGRLHLQGWAARRLRFRRWRALHGLVLGRPGQHPRGSRSGARRSRAALRMAELAYGAERDQPDRQDLCRELFVPDVLLLRRPSARDRQRLVQMVRTGKGGGIWRRRSSIRR